MRRSRVRSPSTPPPNSSEGVPSWTPFSFSATVHAGRAYNPLMNFQIWGNVRTVGPQRYYVTVSAIRDDDADRTGDVETGEAPTREEAILLRDRLIDKVSERLRS